jgi:nucleotide-binding universal stress UspA family protein
MFSLTTIIVGCDLSEGGDLALARAIALAELHRAKIVLVHAEADDAPVSNVDNEMLEQLSEVSAAMRAEEAVQVTERLAAVHTRGIVAEVRSRVGPPGEVLATAAAELGAELIAVGTHGRTGISRFLIGSVAAEVIRNARCDVLVCRGPTGSEPFQRPLVATDFSPSAVKVIDHAARISAAKAPIEVVHAWQLPVGSWGASLLGQARFPWSTVRDAMLASAKGQGDKLIADHPLSARLHLSLHQGPAPSVITHAAESGGHDLVAVGAHGHRGVRRLLLGSVAESTVRHAQCSVLIVHHDEPQKRPSRPSLPAT